MAITLRHNFKVKNNTAQIIIPALVFNSNQTQKIISATEVERLNLSNKGFDFKPFRALLDTGATHTCITESIVKDLKIEANGSRIISSASGESERPTCNFSVALVEPNKVGEKNGKKLYQGTMNLNKIHGTIWPDVENFDLILGMDIITKGILIIDGKGTSILSIN